MMKGKLLFFLIFTAGLVFVNFSGYQVYGQTPQNKTAKQQAIKYTCTMHPEVIKNRPGNCPKCGMKFVEKKDNYKGIMYQAKDTCIMRHDQKKMKHDSVRMKKGHIRRDSVFMKNDSAFIKHNRMM